MESREITKAGFFNGIGPNESVKPKGGFYKLLFCLKAEKGTAESSEEVGFTLGKHALNQSSVIIYYD